MKGSPFYSDSNKISKFEEFGHKILRISSSTIFLCKKIVPFWCSERINLIIAAEDSYSNLVVWQVILRFSTVA